MTFLPSLLEFDWGKRLTAWLITLPGTAISLGATCFHDRFSCFYLIRSPTSSDKLAFSPKTSVRVQQIIDSISKQIGRYLTMRRNQRNDGIAVWMALKLIGGFLCKLGVLAFLLNFIPILIDFGIHSAHSCGISKVYPDLHPPS